MRPLPALPRRARPGEVLAELHGLASGFVATHFRPTFTFAVPRPAAALPARFAIVSVQATTGESWSGERNQAADKNLHRLLLTRGFHPVRITGASSDGRHAEPDWLAETTLQDAVQIGREFLQEAIYSGWSRTCCT